MLSVVVMLGWLLWLAITICTTILYQFPAFLVPFAISIVYSWFVFKDTLNKLQVAGNVYWIVRDTPAKGVPFVARGIMRETDAPWRRGSGVQIRVPLRIIQVGICDKGTKLDEFEGLTAVLDARLLDSPATVLREWK